MLSSIAHGQLFSQSIDTVEFILNGKQLELPLSTKPDPVVFKRENPGRQHCMPWEESYKLHEMAARSIYNDSIIQVREQVVRALEQERDSLKIAYEAMLLTEFERRVNAEDRNTEKDVRINSLERANKKARRSGLWQDIQKGLSFIAGFFAGRRI